MRLSRRSFLQLLAFIPAVAALPTTALAISELPAEVDVDPALHEIESGSADARRHAWLTINDVAVDVKSITLMSRPLTIDMSDFLCGRLKPYVIGTTDGFEAEFFCDDPAPLTKWQVGDAAKIDAQFGARRLAAHGFFKSLSWFDVARLLTYRAGVCIRDARWELV